MSKCSISFGFQSDGTVITDSCHSIARGTEETQVKTQSIVYSSRQQNESLKQEIHTVQYKSYITG